MKYTHYALILEQISMTRSFFYYNFYVISMSPWDLLMDFRSFNSNFLIEIYLMTSINAVLFYLLTIFYRYVLFKM